MAGLIVHKTTDDIILHKKMKLCNQQCEPNDRFLKHEADSIFKGHTELFEKKDF